MNNNGLKSIETADSLNLWLKKAVLTKNNLKIVLHKGKETISEGNTSKFHGFFSL